MATKLKTQETVKPFAQAQESYYIKRREIAEEVRLLEARIKELKEDRDKCDAKLEKAFAECERRSLQDGTIVERTIVQVDEKVCTEDMVGSVLRSAYEYPRYKEIANY